MSFFPVSDKNGKKSIKERAITNNIQDELNKYLNKNFIMGHVHSSNQSMGFSASSSVHGLVLYAFEDCIVMMQHNEIVQMINQPASTNIETLKTRLNTIAEIKPKYYKVSLLNFVKYLSGSWLSKVCPYRGRSIS